MNDNNNKSRSQSKNTDELSSTVDTKKDNVSLEVKPSTAKKTSSEISKKEVTAGQFSNMCGLNDGVKFWAGKRFAATEKRKVSKWSEEFILQGAIHETPSILK